MGAWCAAFSAATSPWRMAHIVCSVTFPWFSQPALIYTVQPASCAGLPKGQPDPDLLALYVGTAGLYAGVAELAATGSAQACGLAQLLTHETRKMTNRQAQPLRSPATGPFRRSAEPVKRNCRVTAPPALNVACCLSPDRAAAGVIRPRHCLPATAWCSCVQGHT